MKDISPFYGLIKDFTEIPGINDTTEKPKKLYEVYFKDSAQLKGNFNKFPIKDGCRIIKKRNDERAYDEVFMSTKQKYFGGISENISFIFPPNERVYDKKIGFRFYQKNPLISTDDNIPYFTLVLKYYRRFEILEKHSSITDSEGNIFINKELNCLEIMNDIISDKYTKNEDNIKYIFPYTVVELLGFIYSIKENSTDKIVVLEPYFPSPFVKETIKEEFHERKEKTLYIEPILFDRHISILIFYYRPISRNNILIDFSLYHYKTLIKYNPIFTDEMRANLTVFPNISIQYGLSCSIWFIGAMSLLMENNILQILNENIRVVICKIVAKINKIMRNEDLILSLDVPKDLENQSLSLYTFISLNTIFNPFLSIEGIGSIFEINNEHKDKAIEFQKHFYLARKVIDELLLNKKYFKLISDKYSFDENYYIMKLQLYQEAEKQFKEIMEKKIKLDKIPIGSLTINDYDSFKKIEAKEELIKTNLNNIIESKKEFYFLTAEDFHRIFNENNDIFLEILNN